MSKALRLFNEAGIEVDMTQPDSVPIRVSMRAVAKAVDDLQDVNKRRKDRRIGVADRREGTTELLVIKGV